MEVKFLDTIAKMEAAEIYTIVLVTNEVIISAQNRRMFFNDHGELQFIVAVDKDGFETKRWNMRHVKKIEWKSGSVKDILKSQ